MSQGKKNQPDPADEYVDLTPEGAEPSLDDLEAEASAEEMLDRLDFGSPDQGMTEDASDTSEDETPGGGALRAERDELEQKLLRTAADYQNYVRRMSRQLETVQQQRVVDIARALVTTLDHFDRALQTDPEQTTPEELLHGVASIRDEVVKALGVFGFSRLDVEPGEEFDPNRHEALMHQPHDDVEAGHVIQTLMPGYFVNDTPVRPAQVSVAQ